MEWEITVRPSPPGSEPPVGLDREGPYRDAMLRSPHKAASLERMLREQRRLAGRIAEAVDEGSRARLFDELRSLRRDEARLLVEVWYEELGGEG